MPREVSYENMKALEEDNDHLRNLLRLADIAIGHHAAPDDCYATGPRTGDPIQDLVICPACAYLEARNS